MSLIKLNDILQLPNLSNVKIRFNLTVDENWNPIENFKNNDIQSLLTGQYWNYNKNKSYKNGQVTVGFIKIKSNENYWLLFHVGKITKDLNILNGVGYEYDILSEYEKYFGRLIVKFKNSSQNMIRNAESVIDECEVAQILPDIFDNDIFPGYDKVNISWKELTRVLDKETWKTALRNQKGVYLITNTLNGKMYVGSAYGDEMILTRWKSYAESRHGGNKELISLDIYEIENYFRFSLLDIFKAATDKQIILERESWWKDVLLSRKFGYNGN